MDCDIVEVKLSALCNSISDSLAEKRHRYYDPGDYISLFERYYAIRDLLRQDFSDMFGDLPVWQVKVNATTDNDGRGYIDRCDLEKLLRDANYCLEILSSSGKLNVPGMTVMREGVFFAGQYFDALQQIAKILESAKQTIGIIDGYIDGKVLDILKSKENAVRISVITRQVSPDLKTRADAFNKQYGLLEIRTSTAFHDRFVIVDDKDFYHFGASIKDAGHRGFMFSRIEEPSIIDALRKEYQKEWQAAAVEVMP